MWMKNELSQPFTDSERPKTLGLRKKNASSKVFRFNGSSRVVFVYKMHFYRILLFWLLIITQKVMC